MAPEPEKIIEPIESRARELLGLYMAGFENADTTALEKALRADAAIEMVGSRTWFSGKATCLRYLAHVIDSPGSWRMVPTLVNGQPAAVASYRGSAFWLGVLTVTPTGISLPDTCRCTEFIDNGIGISWPLSIAAGGHGQPGLRRYRSRASRDETVGACDGLTVQVTEAAVGQQVTGCGGAGIVER